jgi:hypothetical protein
VEMPRPVPQLFGGGLMSEDNTPIPEGLDLSGETYLGMRVAAWVWQEPINQARIAIEPPSEVLMEYFATHWSTPPKHYNAKRLFTEDDVAKLLAAKDAEIAKLKADSGDVFRIAVGWQETAARYRAALEPSAETKAAYIGQFKFAFVVTDAHGEEVMFTPNVPWSTFKEIMATIRDFAATSDNGGGA